MFYQSFGSGAQRAIRALTILFLVGLTASAFALAVSYSYSAQNEAREAANMQRLTVSGEGKVNITPDIVIITAGSVTTAQRVGDAQQENSKKTSAMIAALKKHGIEGKDIKTISYNIYPQYQYYDAPCSAESCPPRRPPEISGYEVRQTYQIKVRELSLIDKVLTDIVANGANEVQGVAFDVDDKDMAKDQARAKAIEQAKEKALKQAAALGVRLGRIRGVN